MCNQISCGCGHSYQWDSYLLPPFGTVIGEKHGAAVLDCNVRCTGIYRDGEPDQCVVLVTDSTSGQLRWEAREVEVGEHGIGQADMFATARPRGKPEPMHRLDKLGAWSRTSARRATWANRLADKLNEMMLAGDLAWWGWGASVTDDDGLPRKTTAHAEQIALL